MYQPERATGDGTMSLSQLLIPVAILTVWILLQIWVLPRLGIQT